MLMTSKCSTYFRNTINFNSTNTIVGVSYQNSTKNYESFNK